MTVLLLSAIQENVSPASFHTRLGLASAPVRNTDKSGNRESGNTSADPVLMVSLSIKKKKVPSHVTLINRDRGDVNERRNPWVGSWERAGGQIFFSQICQRATREKEIYFAPCSTPPLSVSGNLIWTTTSVFVSTEDWQMEWQKNANDLRCQ